MFGTKEQWAAAVDTKAIEQELLNNYQRRPAMIEKLIEQGCYVSNRPFLQKINELVDAVNNIEKDFYPKNVTVGNCPKCGWNSNDPVLKKSRAEECAERVMKKIYEHYDKVGFINIASVEDTLNIIREYVKD